MANETIQLDHRIIADIVEPGSKVLDLGSGSGDLLHYLVQLKNVKGQGVELSETAIYQCVEKGLSVLHSDIEGGLVGYPDRSFDYVILNQSLQEVKKVEYLLDEVLRVGQKVIVGFPNFAFLGARIMLFFKGKSPVTDTLPYHWYDTPNLRFLSIKDFECYCRDKGIDVLRAIYAGRTATVRFMPNLFAEKAIFVIRR